MTSHRAVTNQRPGLRLLRQCLPPRGVLIRVLAWSIAESAPAFLSGLALAHAVDGFRAGRTGVAAAWLAALGLAIVAGAVATRGLYATLPPVVEGVRDALMTSVAQGSLAALASSGRTGSAPLTQLIDQVDQVRNLMSALGRSIRTTLAPLVAATLGLFALDLRLGLAAAVPVALALALYAALLARTVAVHRAAAVADERLGADATAVIDGAAAVRGLGVAQWGADRVARAAQSTGRADVDVARVVAARQLVIAIGANLPLLVILLVAGPLVQHHQISLGEVVGAASYVLTVLAPALSATVSGSGSWLVHLVVLLDRLAAIADAPVPEPVRPPTDRAGHASDALTARGATFVYRAGARAIIDGLDLAVEPGELVALVGPSGAGKTTLAHLAAGLLAPSAGTVGASRRARIVLVPQTPYVFSGSLRENLSYLTPPGVSDDDLSAAVDGVGLRTLVDRLGGLDAAIAAGGSGSAYGEISAGERQRIVLARAFLSRADVLILDEAMSLLRADDETRIEGWLRATGRTLLVISHRLDVTARADQVVYFDGRDVHTGAHRDLLARCADYRELAAYAAAS